METSKSKPGYFKNVISLSLLRHGKRYIFGIIATKALIIWFICTRSSDLWSISSQTLPINTINTYHVNNFSLYNITIFHIPLTDQKDVLPFYLEVTSDEWCFINGINIKSSRAQKKCKCLKHWYGMDCGIPEAVWKSSYLQEGQSQGVEIRRRKKPRRIISSVLFLGEFELLDTVIQESYHAVDIFIVPEEDFENPPLLLRNLKKGFLSEFQSKIMPVTIKNQSKISENIREWGIYMFENLWKEAWKRVADFRPDDLFLYSHVSSVLSKDILIFLKLYDGYPEPFKFTLKPSLYQFQRLIANNSFAENVMIFEPIGCTFEYLTRICDYDLKNFFNKKCSVQESTESNSRKKFRNLGTWIIGSYESPAGWQCNWCVRMQDLKNIFKNHSFFMKTFNLSNYQVNNNVTNNTFVKYMGLGKWFDGSDVDIKVIPKSEFGFTPHVREFDQRSARK